MRELLTPDVFNGLIVLNLLVGVLLAAWQLRRDLKRTHHPSPTQHDDTEPRRDKV